MENHDCLDKYDVCIHYSTLYAHMLGIMRHQ